MESRMGEVKFRACGTYRALAFWLLSTVVVVVGFERCYGQDDIRGTIGADARGATKFGLTVLITDRDGERVRDFPTAHIRMVPEVWMGDDGFVSYFSYDSENRFRASCSNNNWVSVTAVEYDQADSSGFYPIDPNNVGDVNRLPEVTILVRSTRAGAMGMRLELKLEGKWLPMDSCVIQIMPLNDLPVPQDWYVDAEHQWPYQDGSEKYPFSTISDAIEVAVNGDTVRISDGTYKENLVIVNKSGLTLRWDGTVKPEIDGDEKGTVVLIQGSNVNIEGLVIRNGRSSENGGGVLCKSGTITLTECEIRDNFADANGGGIAVDRGCTLTIQSCTIEDNEAEQHGGGLFGHARIEGSPDDEPVCTTFTANRASMGGGICCSAGTTDLTNCLFTGNQAGWGNGNGGAVAVTGASGKVTANKCTFAGNRAAEGQTLYVNSNCSVTSDLIIKNSILWNSGNEVASASSIKSISIHYCDVFDLSTLPFNLLHCFDQNPLFADSGFWDDSSTPDHSDDEWNNGDYHLKSEAGRHTGRRWVNDDETSLCIDKGDPAEAVGRELPPNGNRINIGVYAGTIRASRSP